MLLGSNPSQHLFLDLCLGRLNRKAGESTNWGQNIYWQIEDDTTESNVVFAHDLDIQLWQEHIWRRITAFSWPELRLLLQQLHGLFRSLPT